MKQPPWQDCDVLRALRIKSDDGQVEDHVSRGLHTRLFFHLDGRKHEKYEELCEPMGLHSGVGRLSGRHGERVGISQQARQQRRRSIFADLPYVCCDLQLNI